MRTSVLRAKSPARESYSDGILPLVEMDAGKQAWPSRRLLRSGSTFGWHGGGSVSCLPTIRISPVIESTSPAAARAPALRARPAAEIRAHRVAVCRQSGFRCGAQPAIRVPPRKRIYWIEIGPATGCLSGPQYVWSP
jgi:hypothetical protein